MPLHFGGTRGSTLIEVVIAIAIAALLVGTLGTMAHMAYQARGHAEARREVEEQGRQALEAMRYAVRNSAAIVAPTEGASGVTLEVTGDADAVFALSGTALTLAEDAGSPLALTNSRVTADAFTVENLSRAGTAGTVRVSLTLSSANTAAPFVYTQTFYGSAARE